MLNTGLQFDPIDPRNAVAEDLGIVAAGEIVPVPRLSDKVPFVKQRQGAIPFCTAFDNAYRLQYSIYKMYNLVVNISERYWGVISETTKDGNSCWKVNQAGTKGVVKEDDCAFPDIFSWTWSKWPDLFDIDKQALNSVDRFFPPNWITIMPNNYLMLNQIVTDRPVGVIIPLFETWNAPEREVVANGKKIIGWHKTTIDGRNADGTWTIIDSLGPQKRILAPDYEFTYLEYYGTLPDNWKQTQSNNKNVLFPNCVVYRYGKPRQPLFDEQKVAIEMRKAFERFSNPIVRTVAGRFWNVYLNAVLYGGYNFQYYKLGMWHAGDVINDAYNFAKTGKHIFDFNLNR